MKNYRPPFRGEFRSPNWWKVFCISNPKGIASKDKLREEVKSATEEYLSEGKKIEKFPDGPIVKVPSVGLKDLGNELTFGIGELYEAPDVYAEMEIQLNKQLMEGDL